MVLASFMLFDLALARPMSYISEIPNHKPQTMRLYPAESVNSDTEIGGFVCIFPSGATKQVAWKSQAPIQDTLTAAKQYTASLIEHLSSKALHDDMERTNWASCVAAVQKIIQDWNEVRRKVLYAERGHHAAPVQ